MIDYGKFKVYEIFIERVLIMKAVKKLLLGAAAVLTLMGCEFHASWIPPTYDEFKDEAEWKIWDRGYENLEYQSHDEQDEGWRYHFNYHATKYNKDYEVGVSCEADRYDDDNDGDYHEIKSRVTSYTLISE